jgi:glycerol-3-phosphate dehydrogenase
VKRDLDAIVAREHDVLVIGGGIHGAFAAWDAAQRGLKTALVEAVDFGAGTSWNSLKTIHGGLRYLQGLDLPRMRESIRERRTLLRIAPALVKPLRFVVPTYGHGLKGREALALALAANDFVSRDRNVGLPKPQQIPPGRSLSREEILRLVPGIPAAGLSGGAAWTDAQVASSERLLIGVLQAAAAAHAVLANHARVVGFGVSGDRITVVRLEDMVSGDIVEVRARVILNAAGPGMDDVLALAGSRRPPVPLLSALNLVLRRPVVREHALGALANGRYLFMVPWAGRAIVGTDYVPAAHADPAEDGRRFLAEAARAYPWARLEPADVTLVHRGRVPGRSPRRLASRHLLIDHARDGLAGLVSVQGAKYTTARAVAEAAIDLVARKLAVGRPSRTAATVLKQAAPLAGALTAQALAAVKDEMALTLSDIVLRRLDLVSAGLPSESDLDAVVLALADALGWDAIRVANEKAGLAESLAGLAL